MPSAAVILSWAITMPVAWLIPALLIPRLSLGVAVVDQHIGIADQRDTDRIDQQLPGLGIDLKREV